MENLIMIIFVASWGGLCYMVGRFTTVNKALEKQWGPQKEFHEWKNNKDLNEKNLLLKPNNYENG